MSSSINNRKRELDAALAEEKKGKHLDIQEVAVDPSKSLTSASAVLHLGGALDETEQAASPVTQSMLADQHHKEQSEQEQFLHVLNTLASQIQKLGNPAETGQPNGLVEQLSQQYFAEQTDKQTFSDAYSSQLGPEMNLSLFSKLAHGSKNPELEKPSSPKGLDAIFAAAGNINQILKDSEQQIIDQLKREITMIKTEIKAMKQMIKFFKEEGKVFEQFYKNPSYQTLKNLIDFLKAHCQSDPKIEKYLDKMDQVISILHKLFSHMTSSDFRVWDYFVLSDPDEYHMDDHGNIVDSCGIPFDNITDGNPEFDKFLKHFTETMGPEMRKLIDQLVPLTEIDAWGDGPISNYGNVWLDIVNTIEFTPMFFPKDYAEWFKKNVDSVLPPYVPADYEKTLFEQRPLISMNDIFHMEGEKLSGNPQLFEEFLRYGQKGFKQIIKQLIQNIEKLIGLINTIESKDKDVIFKMESILINLEEKAINSNSKQSKQRREMADEIEKALQNTMQKLIDAQKKIAKAEHESHHHGFFGAIEDFFESIAHKIEDILKSVKDSVCGVVDEVKGDSAAASSQFKKAKEETLHTVKGLIKFSENVIKASEEVVNGVRTGNFNEVLKGTKTLAVDALIMEAGSMVAKYGLGPMFSMGGPAGGQTLFGAAMYDTKFGTDLQNLSKIAVDATASLGRAILGSFEKLAAKLGDKQAEGFAKTNLHKAKQLGEDILTNPQFQTFMDMVQIVMIASAVATDQYWLAGMMAVMLVSNDFGGTQFATQKLTEGLEYILHACGVKETEKMKEWCKVTADIMVISAVMVTGAAFGAFSEGTEESFSMIGDTLDDEASTAKEGSQSLTRRAVEAGKSFLRNNGTALMTLGATLGTSSLGIDIAKAAEKKGDHHLEELLMILQMCISVAFSLSGGLGMGMQESPSLLTQSIKGTIRKMSSTLADYLENNLGKITALNHYIQVGGMLLEAGAEAGKGGMKVMAADLIKIIAQYENDMHLFEATSKDNNAGIHQNNEHLKATIKEYEQIVKNFDAPSKAGEGVEQALLENS